MELITTNQGENKMQINYNKFMGEYLNITLKCRVQALIEEVSHEEILNLTGYDVDSALYCYVDACGFPEDEAHILMALEVLEIADGRGFNFSVADANR
jgi:hypothetical protein